MTANPNRVRLQRHTLNLRKCDRRQVDWARSRSDQKEYIGIIHPRDVANVRKTADLVKRNTGNIGDGRLGAET